MTFDQYQRLMFKNRMFSLPNDLLSQFSVLFTNSFLAVHDFIDNRIHGHKTEQCQNSTAYFNSLQLFCDL